MERKKRIMDVFEQLYSKPLLSSRSGALYNTFPYPTKISPEAIAVYIACMTKPGDTVLDPFAGSGSTGLAALLCEFPTDRMKQIAEELQVEPVWGARNAVLYEISTYASFAMKTIVSRISEKEYQNAVASFMEQADILTQKFYSVKDPDGKTGQIRYVIWSEILLCPDCGKEISYFQQGTCRNPVEFKKEITCPHCRQIHQVSDMSFATERYFDKILGQSATRKKRNMEWIYGTTDGKNWDRPANEADRRKMKHIDEEWQGDDTPQKIEWGELHRAGYHYGITHLHHFYTMRNYIVMSKLWKLAGTYPDKLADAIKLLLLSYNASHSTWMTRVVAKTKAKDFVLTSAQSGVLYISKIPVEKNIVLGLKRKAKSFAETYSMLQKCTGRVTIHNVSSTKMIEKENDIDFVFTDPPFGDFIPYAEVNQINELWLNQVTDRTKEVIISASQNKDIAAYQELLAKIFKEISRVLRPGCYASIVFHAAKAKVWEAFAQALSDAELQVQVTNILDKTQSSFKQTVAAGSVQGDPLFLLKKGKAGRTVHVTDDEILENLLNDREVSSDFDKRRCYTNYVNHCLKEGAAVTKDAKQVYQYYDSRKRNEMR